MNKRISNADTSSASLSVDLETAVSSTASCVLIDQTRYTDGPEAVQAWLQHTTMSLAIELHQIDGANVSENTLLRRLKLNHHVADESVSPYRQLTSIIDNGERSVLVVHQADQLADKGLHIVARLARYIVRSESNWKILLIGDGKRFGDLDLFQLPIDLIFEQGKSKLAAKGIAAQHATDPYQSNSQLPAILL